MLFNLFRTNILNMLDKSREILLSIPEKLECRKKCINPSHSKCMKKKIVKGKPQSKKINK